MRGRAPYDSLPPLRGRVRVGGMRHRAWEVILVDMPTVLARQLRRNATDAERRLWSLLRRRQLAGFRFRRQVPIGPYIVDFACLARNSLSKSMVASITSDKLRTRLVQHGLPP